MYCIDIVLFITSWMVKKCDDQQMPKQMLSAYVHIQIHIPAPPPPVKQIAGIALI